MASGRYIPAPLGVEQLDDRCPKARENDRQAGASLELRLERIKRLGNLQLDYIKRLYDGPPIGEKYLSGVTDLHVHFTMNGMWCATYRKADIIEVAMFASLVGSHKEGPACAHQFPVFVWVREIAKSLRPFASVVRLQPLDCCYMAGIEALEPYLFRPLEALWRVFNGKLRAVLSQAGIESGEFEDQIIESTSKVVTDLSNQDAHTHRDKCAVWGTESEAVRRIRIEVQADGFFLLPERIEEPLPQISKVFTCPDYSFERAIESMRCHDIII